MAKYTVLRGKVSIGDKKFVKGDTIEITVKDAEKFPQSMIQRVLEPSKPAPKKEDPVPKKETPAPVTVPEPEPEPKVADEPKAEKIRVTI